MKKIFRIKFWLLLLFTIVVTQLQAQTKAFYGTTNKGGINYKGVIFKTDANGENQTVVYNFSGQDGSGPNNGKLCYVNGSLYGTTSDGGTNNNGVLFSYNPSTETFTKLHDFYSNTSGDSPYSNVILASNGKLYGTTRLGGSIGYGTLFEFDITTATLTIKVDFDSANLGRDIFANVIQASNGKLYGVTNRGGANSAGVMYEYDYTTEVITKLIDFETTTLGIAPTMLVEVENDILYGTCSGGGINGDGTIFKYVISTNTITKKFDFDEVNSGRLLTLSLMLSSNGNLYGLTRGGGQNTFGVLYEYNISTETFTKKLDFTTETGYYAGGRLLEASNGNLYGLNFKGGLDNYGTLFQYNIITNQINKKFDFSLTSGSNPNGTLIEIELSNLGNEEFIQNPLEVILWPNPVSELLNVKSNEELLFILKIYNLLGQELTSNSIFKASHQLNVSHLNSGIYLLKLSTKNGNSQTLKFIKN